MANAEQYVVNAFNEAASGAEVLSVVNPSERI